MFASYLKQKELFPAGAFLQEQASEKVSNTREATSQFQNVIFL